MLSHSLPEKIQVKKITFYFDYSKNDIQFYKSEINELLVIDKNKAEYRIYDKNTNIKYIIDYSNSKTFSEKNYYNKELTYENIYSKKSNKLIRLNKYNLFGNICITYEYGNKLKILLNIKTTKYLSYIIGIINLLNMNRKILNY